MRKRRKSLCEQLQSYRSKEAGLLLLLGSHWAEARGAVAMECRMVESIA